MNKNTICPDFLSKIRSSVAASTKLPFEKVDQATIEALESRTLLSTVYTASAGFSALKNPNGPWGFGYSATETSAFVPYTILDSAEGIAKWTAPNHGSGDIPGIFENVSSQTMYSQGLLPITPGQLVEDPGYVAEYGGASQFSVVRFTTPAAASYSVSVTFESDYEPHTTNDVHVLDNEKSVFDGLVKGYGSSSTVGTTFTIGEAAEGTTIDFVVGNGGIVGGTYDNTILNATITATLSSAVHIKGSTIVPTAAPTLNLGSLFGGEEVNIPTELTNPNSTPQSGPLTIRYGLSASGSSTNPLLVASSTEVFSGTVPADGSVSDTIQWTVPTTGATAGKKYYFVAELLRASGGVTSTSATTQQFEFLGTPRYNPAFFSSGGFFSFVSDTIKGILALQQKQKGADPADAASFIRAFEGDTTPAGAPYLDGSGDPTIGIGIDLEELNSQTETALVSDVKAYYLSTYKINVSKLTETQIVEMLEAQAPKGAVATVPGIGKISRRAALSQAQELSLFTYIRPQYVATAKRIVTSYSALPVTVQVALVDMAFNGDGEGGAVFAEVASALDGPTPDYVLAAFDLCDSSRPTNPKNPGLRLRVEAEFQNYFLASSSIASKAFLLQP